MAGARALQLGFERVADNAMERFRGDLPATGLPEPALEVQGSGQPSGGREPCSALREDRWGQRLVPGWRPRFFIG